uniref:Uncharacterized protein n=1 Tax=Glossina palpalis gambiensis TaxID=67801 RepID=A0A1B0AUY3_9MUSC
MLASMGGGSCTSETAAERVARCMAIAAACLRVNELLTVVGILATVAEILAFAVAALASKAAAVLATTFVSVESSFSLFSASALPSATIFSTTLLKPLGEDLEILRLLRIRWISSTDKECEMEPEPELLPLK